MQCPVCVGVDLVMSERSGVEIDYCPKCRGVWLDRGELDKIIERSSIPPREQKQNYQQFPQPNYQSQNYQNQQNYSQDYRHQKDYKYKKRESFFSELFDF